MTKLCLALVLTAAMGLLATNNSWAAGSHKSKSHHSHHHAHHHHKHHAKH